MESKIKSNYIHVSKKIISFLVIFSLIITIFTLNDDIVNAEQGGSFNDPIIVKKYGNNIWNYGNFKPIGNEESIARYYKFSVPNRSVLFVNATSTSQAVSNKYDVNLYEIKSETSETSIVQSKLPKIVSKLGFTVQFGKTFVNPSNYILEFKCKKDQGAWNQNFKFYVENTADIKYTYVSQKVNAAYTGTPINFIDSVRIGGADGPLLCEGQDYTVRYSKGNVNPGTGTITIYGINGFYGSRSVMSPYTIRKVSDTQKQSVKKPSTSSKVSKRRVTFKWKKVTGATQYQIKYREKGKKKWKNKTVKSKVRSFTVKKVKRGKKYQFKVRAIKKIGKTKYYSKFSKIKTTKKIK